MGYYSSRKPYYDLTKSQVEFFAGSSRFLKQSLVKESVMEKPYLEDEYQQMHLDIPPPIRPDPYPPWGPFGPIWGAVNIIFPPATCMLAHKYTTAWPFHWWNSCGDVTTVKFYARTFFVEEWSWTYAVSSSELNVEDLDISISENGISLSANIPGTKGEVLVCGTGTAGMIPLTLGVTYLLGEPVPSLRNPPIAFTEMTTQLGIVHCCTEIEFDCDSCPGCENSSIGYTTQQMAVNETQNLSVSDPVAGCVYNWAIASGGGSLSAGTGTSITYTAPSSNPDCANNPTITLSTKGNVCDTLAIAVNAGSGNAYRTNHTDCISSPAECGGACNCGCYCYSYDFYKCDNTFSSHTDIGDPYYCGCTGVCHPTEGWCWEGAACSEECGVVDLRSAAQKTAGCCPAALL